jgi:hypothetical protein
MDGPRNLDHNAMLAPKTISINVTRYGYEIFVQRGTTTIDHYSAGNSAHDSTEVVPLNTPECVPLRSLKAFAHRTAREIAHEHGISPKLIELGSS